MARKKKEEPSGAPSVEFEEVVRIVAGQPVKVKVYKTPAAPEPDEGRIRYTVSSESLREKLFYRD